MLGRCLLSAENRTGVVDRGRGVGAWIAVFSLPRSYLLGLRDRAIVLNRSSSVLDSIIRITSVHKFCIAIT